MDTSELAWVRSNPAFQELTRKRSSFGWTLAIAMMAIYGAFMLLVAFAPGLMAQRIGDGPLTVAFPLGLGVIVMSVLLTGIYVMRANGEFDRLTAEIVGQRRGVGAPAGLRLAESVR